MGMSDNLCLGMAAVYGFFGVTLAISPAVFWGPDSKFSYWTEMDESGFWFGRALGVFMASVVTSPYWAGMSKKSLTKVFLPINALWLYFFYQAAFELKSTGPAPQNILPFNMWLTQLPVAVGLLGMNVLALGEAEGKGKSE